MKKNETIDFKYINKYLKIKCINSVQNFSKEFMSNPDKISLRRILKQKRELISSQRRLEASEAAKLLC